MKKKDRKNFWKNFLSVVQLGASYTTESVYLNEIINLEKYLLENKSELMNSKCARPFIAFFERVDKNGGHVTFFT